MNMHLTAGWISILRTGTCWDEKKVKSLTKPLPLKNNKEAQTIEEPMILNTPCTEFDFTKMDDDRVITYAILHLEGAVEEADRRGLEYGGQRFKS